MEHIKKVINDPEERANYEKQLSDYDAERLAEADFIRKQVVGNNALMAMSISNENRVRAEAEGRAIRTNTGFVEPRKTFEVPLVPLGPGLWKKTLVGIVNHSNASRAVVKLYENNRMRLELFDEEGNLKTFTAEDTVEKPKHGERFGIPTWNDDKPKHLPILYVNTDSIMDDREERHKLEEEGEWTPGSTAWESEEEYEKEQRVKLPYHTKELMEESQEDLIVHHEGVEYTNPFKKGFWAQEWDKFLRFLRIR
jgi:hypothetical protein